MKGFVSDISGTAQQIAIHHFISKWWISFYPLALFLSCPASRRTAILQLHVPGEGWMPTKSLHLLLHALVPAPFPEEKAFRGRFLPKFLSHHIHVLSLHILCSLGMCLCCAMPKRWAICATICLIAYFKVASTVSLLSFPNSDRIQRKTLQQYKQPNHCLPLWWILPANSLSISRDFLRG